MKKHYISILTIICSFLVVLFHCNRVYLINDSIEWVSSDLIENIIYFAVPVFLMITGVNLINYKERYSTKTYIKKRVINTLVPYLVFSFIIILYKEIILSVTNQPLMNFKDILIAIFTGYSCDFYWFFVPLFICYIFIPFISLINKEKQEKYFRYIILIGLVLIGIIPTICEYCNLFTLRNYLNGFNLGFIIYPIIGYYLDHYLISKKLELVSIL